MKHVDPDNCELHLVMYGIDKTYTRWTKHGEKDTGSSVSWPNLERCELLSFDTSTFEADRLQDIANTIEVEFSECPKK